MTRLTGASRLCAATGIALLLLSGYASAQELEPGAYWPIPAGLNIATVVGISTGAMWRSIRRRPSTRQRQDQHDGAVVRASVQLGGTIRQAGVALPIIGGHVEGLYLGQPADVGRFGQGDPRLRVAMNLYGAPAMTPKEFASYEHKTLVGVSLVVTPPLGQYDPAKLINLGTNRWSFKPEIGFSQAHGKWVVEAMAGVWLFTDNTNFSGGHTRDQDPIVGTQFHLTYKFQRTMWLAADANYFTGGRTTIGGRQNVDLQRNSRVGATFSRALTRRSALRMSVSRGAYTTIGANFTSIAAGYNYAWAR